MTSVTVPKNQLDRIENRLKNLEDILLRFLNQKSKDDDKIFRDLVNSDRFQNELKEDLKLLKKDPSKFVNPFETYRKKKIQ